MKRKIIATYNCSQSRFKYRWGNYLPLFGLRRL